MNLKKVFGIALSIAATAYTLWYMHFGDPKSNSGALSKIGLEHHTYFVIWGILTMLALSFGIISAYRRLLKTKIYIPLLLIAGTGMLFTLCFDFDYDIKPDYYFHCAGSLTFSVVMGITIFLLFLLNWKKAKIYRLFTVLTCVILLIDLVFLVIFKETALIEVLPVLAGYIMLGITNLRSDRVEAYK